MLRIFRHYIPKPLFLLGVIDCLILLGSIIGGLELRYWTGFGEAPQLGEHIPEIVVFVAIQYLVMLSLGLYHRGTCLDLKIVIIRLALSFLAGFIVMSAIFYTYQVVVIWRSVFLIAVVIAYVAIVFARSTFSGVVDHTRFKRRVLILGAGERAATMLSLRGNDISPGYVCVAFLKMSEEESAVAEARSLADIDSLLDFARTHSIDEIVIATEERRGKLPVKELLACRLDGIVVTDYSSFVERESGRVDLDSLTPSWFIFSDGFMGGRRDLLIKRAFDVAVSLTILLFSLPIILLAVIAILVTSPGPIFYRQERVGLHGRAFDVLKFRSMRVDAEKEGVPQWAGKNDARVTPIGRLIRATRIDELPQLINVLRGDMSFVGPRPERPFFVDSLSEEIPYYPERHQVKPGITGWAQLNYPYGASVEDAKQKLQYDLYYVKNCSIFLDFLILIQTVRVVLWPDGVR